MGDGGGLFDEGVGDGGGLGVVGVGEGGGLWDDITGETLYCFNFRTYPPSSKSERWQAVLSGALFVSTFSFLLLTFLLTYLYKGSRSLFALLVF